MIESRQRQVIDLLADRLHEASLPDPGIKVRATLYLALAEGWRPKNNPIRPSPEYLHWLSQALAVLEDGPELPS